MKNQNVDVSSICAKEQHAFASFVLIEKKDIIVVLRRFIGSLEIQIITFN